MKICFTGKRKINNNIDFLNSKDWDLITQEIYDYLFDLMNKNLNEEYHFITGGALGTDLLAFGCIETFKSEHKQFKIINEIAIPFKGYEAKWNDIWKKRLTKVLTVADIRTNVEDINNYKSKSAYQKLQKRNEYMIDNSDLVIAVWDQIEKGGTWNAIKYAETKNKKIHKILIKEVSK